MFGEIAHVGIWGDGGDSLKVCTDKALEELLMWEGKGLKEVPQIFGGIHN
jgi:hypothetical protein